MSGTPTPLYSGPGVGLPVVDVDAKIEARVRPLEDDIRHLAETTNRFAETTQKAISNLSDRMSNETKETHSLIRLSSTEAKSEAAKVADTVASMNKDRGKINYTALGVLVSFIALITGGGQVVGHWLMESRIAPITEQIKAEQAARVADTQVFKSLMETQTKAFSTMLEAESKARTTVAENLAKMNDREVERNNRFDALILEMTEKTALLKGREDAIYELYRGGQLRLGTDASK